MLPGPGLGAFRLGHWLHVDLGAATRMLDEISMLLKSDALLCTAYNWRISVRFMQRWGWEPHCPTTWWHRHFIKRFYGTEIPRAGRRGWRGCKIEITINPSTDRSAMSDGCHRAIFFFFFLKKKKKKKKTPGDTRPTSAALAALAQQNKGKAVYTSTTIRPRQPIKDCDQDPDQRRRTG